MPKQYSDEELDKRDEERARQARLDLAHAEDQADENLKELWKALKGYFYIVVALIAYYWFFGPKGTWPNLFYNMFFN